MLRPIIWFLSTVCRKPIYHKAAAPAITEDSMVFQDLSALAKMVRMADIAHPKVGAILPHMHNLTVEVQSVTRGKHERGRWRYPDRKEPQTAGHQSPVRGRRVSGHPDRRGRAEGRRRL